MLIVTEWASIIPSWIKRLKILAMRRKNRPRKTCSHRHAQIYWCRRELEERGTRYTIWGEIIRNLHDLPKGRILDDVDDGDTDKKCTVNSWLSYWMSQWSSRWKHLMKAHDKCNWSYRIKLVMETHDMMRLTVSRLTKEFQPSPNSLDTHQTV